MYFIKVDFYSFVLPVFFFNFNSFLRNILQIGGLGNHKPQRSGREITGVCGVLVVYIVRSETRRERRHAGMTLQRAGLTG